MKLFPDRLAEDLERRLAPVYLVAGPERLVVEESADQVRRTARSHQIAERIPMTADGRFDWEDLFRATETASLFATRRLVEVRLPSGKPGADGGKAIRRWLEAARDDVLMLLCDQWEIAQEKSAWFKAVDQAGVFVPAWNIKPAQLPRWIEARLRARGLSADEQACRFLAERLEGNLLAAAQEVDRLALLYPDQKLDLDTLRRAVADNARFDAFRLTELVLTGQAAQALRCLRALRVADTPAPAVLWALGRELELAAAVARGVRPAQEIFREQRVWEARQQPISACANRLGASDLERALAQLSRLDCIAKGQRPGDFWVELERFATRVALGFRRLAA